MADGEPEVDQLHGILASGTLGGRLIKDKTFFFFSYEGLRLRLPQIAVREVPLLASYVEQFKKAFPANPKP